MAVTPSAGYPDFTRPNQWSAVPYINDNISISADKLYTPPAFVGGFGGVEVLFTGNVAVGWVVQLLWTADAALLVGLDSVFLRAPAATQIWTYTFNRGPFLAVKVSATDYSVPRSYSLIVFPRDVPGTSSGVVGGPALIQQTGVTINNGAQRIDTSLRCTLGHGQLSVGTVASKWRARVMGVDQAGVESSVQGACSNGPDGSNSVPVVFDSYTSKVVIVNDDPAPQVFNIGLNCVV